MKPYKHKDSGIDAYETGDTWIKIRFRHSDTYIYTYKSAGKDNIEKMKLLAQLGTGLNTFISKYVKENYERKL